MKNILKNFAAFGIAPLVALGIALATMGGASAEEGGNAAEPSIFRSTIPSRKSGAFPARSEPMTRASFSAA